MERSSPETVAEGKSLCSVLAIVLSRLIEANSVSGHDRLTPQSITKFHALVPPGICIADYLDRILKYSSCSNECFVLALIYIDRLIQFNNFALTSFNVHRVIITSILVAAKFFDDQYYNNAYYARVGGVPCSELNSLETDFLFGVNFGLHVEADEYYKYRTQLANHTVLIPGHVPSCKNTQFALRVERTRSDEKRSKPKQQRCSTDNQIYPYLGSTCPLYG